MEEEKKAIVLGADNAYMDKVEITINPNYSPLI
ncbi:glycosyl transferase family 8 [Streptococcus pneumoniae]|nr:glycosyl transferase family 8 [Streptococcus pneumoniae]MDS5745802.1 glycosyl transferase family 8 [Streptococcus pneumoniae]